MFEIGGTELLLIAVVALLVIGPKELPNALRTVGRYTGKARAMTRHLRSGFDEMMRQAELEEMEKQWAEHNRTIMAQTPVVPDYAPPAAPAAAEAPPEPPAEAPTAAPSDPLAPDPRPLP
jgi:sec-independent protein translocase protein TatB